MRNRRLRLMQGLASVHPHPPEGEGESSARYEQCSCRAGIPHNDATKSERLIGIRVYRVTPPASERGKDFAQSLDRAEHLLLWQPRPLATHNEMIDAEQFAVARDLF